jgi:hypothetical protein
MQYGIRVLKKIIEVLSFLIRKLFQTEKNRDFGIKITGLVLFYPITTSILKIISKIITPFIVNFQKHNLITKYVIVGMVLLTIVLLTMLVLEILIGKPLKTDNVVNRTRKVSLRERLFSLLPYLWFLAEIILSLRDDAALFVNGYFPDTVSRPIIKDFLIPFSDAFYHIPEGMNFAMSNYMFYVKYFYVGRSRNKFTYFVRYYYMQSILMGSFFSFTIHCFQFLPRYGIESEYISLIGLFIFTVYFFSTLYVMAYIIIGKQNKFPFMDESIQYHIGRRKRK